MLGPIPLPPPRPPNPLTPLVMELTNKLLAVTQGKLFARCSVERPCNIAELIALMRAAGMDAAVWLLENYVRQDYADMSDVIRGYEDDFADIQKILQRKGPGKLNDIEAIINPPEDEEAT